MSGGRVVSGSERRFPRSLIEFQDRFATEGACAEYLFERRWPEGFVCPGCGGRLGGRVTAESTCTPIRTRTARVAGPAGRSGVGKMLVAGAVEIDGGNPRRARLKVIEGFGKPELHSFVLGAVAPQTRLVTDDWPSYRDLPDVQHNAITLGPMAAHIALPCVGGDPQLQRRYRSASVLRTRTQP